jgi:hypothetical protein
VSGSLKTQWENQGAADYIHIAAAKFGQPSSLDPTVGGMAIWRDEFLRNSCLSRVEVRDEAIPHCVTGCVNHVDFVRVYINYELIPSRFMEVSSLTKNNWLRCAKETIVG